jgi:hypothetical protein
MEKELTPAPTREVPFTTGLALGVAAAIDLGSPALSANVFRCLGSGSLSVEVASVSVLPDFIPD